MTRQAQGTNPPRIDQCRRRRCAQVIAIILAGLLLGACASQSPKSEIASPFDTATSENAFSWWGVRFRLAWPEDSEPAWHMDLLLADRVIRPALTTYRDAIGLWRVHRRAARDGAGHQFSFLFYARPRTAARLYREIRANATLDRLRARGRVEAVGYDDLSNGAKPGREHGADERWSPAMRRAWPAFIMGVSQAWLDLIAELGRDRRRPPGLESRYRAIAADLDRHWLDEGGHALLHHLNAVFGYRDVIVTRRGPMRF